MKSLSRKWVVIAGLALLALAAGASYFARLESNPPGFYIDESSIAYNAWMIATTGCDEHGKPWPLYFRAFADYKNPVSIYLLAALYRLTGPSILVARSLSAVAVLAAGGVLGLLGFRLTRSLVVALLIMTAAFLTPWLFELGRVAVEVALYPLALGLLLLSVQRAATKAPWAVTDIHFVAGTLALLTYSYSIGRVLGPLLAAGLVLFWTRQRRTQIGATWFLYGITLIPIAAFSMRDPGALSYRFNLLTYLTPDMGFGERAWEFARHYVRNINLRRLLLTGDPNPDQIVHLFGTYQFLAPVFALSVIGAVIVVRTRRADPWWRFVLYCCVVALVPASLTKSHFHMLRLVAVPVLLLVFAIPGIALFLEKGRSQVMKLTFALLAMLTLVQAVHFQWKYRQAERNPTRVHLFDGEYREKIFDPAIASKADPIYIADALWIPGYIQAYWYGTLRGIDSNRFNRLPPTEAAPLGSVVISTEENCPGCEVLAASPPYTLYIAREKRPRSPLPLEALRADIVVLAAPQKMRTQTGATLLVKVKNLGSSTWLARERGGGPYQVGLGNHWLDAAGNMIVHDDGRSALLRDLKPGETVELPLTVNAPKKPGDYLLEIDMLQEGVSWFGLAGSSVVRVPMRVE
jgi:hypothetical protein